MKKKEAEIQFLFVNYNITIAIVLKRSVYTKNDNYKDNCNYISVYTHGR